MNLHRTPEENQHRSLSYAIMNFSTMSFRQCYKSSTTTCDILESNALIAMTSVLRVSVTESCRSLDRKCSLPVCFLQQVERQFEQPSQDYMLHVRLASATSPRLIYSRCMCYAGGLVPINCGSSLKRTRNNFGELLSSIQSMPDSPLIGTGLTSQYSCCTCLARSASQPLSLSFVARLSFDVNRFDIRHR